MYSLRGSRSREGAALLKQRPVRLNHRSSAVGVPTSGQTRVPPHKYGRWPKIRGQVKCCRKRSEIDTKRQIEDKSKKYLEASEAFDVGSRKERPRP